MTWTERLTTALKVGHFTPQDREDSENWSKCDVGEQRAARESELNGAASVELTGLGIKFDIAVLHDDVLGAIAIHTDIEKEIERLCQMMVNP